VKRATRRWVANEERCSVGAMKGALLDVLDSDARQRAEIRALRKALRDLHYASLLSHEPLIAPARERALDALAPKRKAKR